MPFLFALLLTIFIVMQMTELPIVLIWVYYIYDLVLG